MFNLVEIMRLAKKYIDAGMYLEATNVLLKNYAGISGSPQLHIQLIQLLLETKAHKEAKVVLDDAFEKFKNNPQLLFLGSMYAQEIGEPELAVTRLERFVSLKKDMPFAWANLCQLLEQLNRLEALETTLKSIPQQYRGFPLIRLVEARFYRRKDKFEDAVQCLNSLEGVSLQDWQKASVLYEYSKIYDKLEDFNLAWKKVTEANQITASLWPSDWFSSTAIEKMLLQCQAFILQPEEPCSNQLSLVKQEVSHCFLIGFPRSGTTLLDKALDCHSHVSVMDEQPVLESVVKGIGGYNYMSKLSQLDNSEKKSLRNMYWDKVKTVNPELLKNKVFVDKLPMNIMYLPAITDIFPEAKIIIALRHPLDCCLSCYFQEFKPIEPLARFLDFNKTLTFYDQIFEAAMQVLEQIPERVFFARYEEILSDFEAQLSKLLEFSGVKWEPQIKQFHRHALKNRINTPSYYQVTKPLYKNSMYRWKNYPEQMIEAKVVLQKWIEKFKYKKD